MRSIALIVCLLAVAHAAPLPPVSIGGKQVDLVGEPPTKMGLVSQALADKNVAAALWVPSDSKMPSDECSASAVKQADTKPLSAEGQQYVSTKKAKLIVFMPGFGSFPPSAAFLVRLAKFADKVVVLNQYQFGPNNNKLVAATEIDGIPLPSGASGRIFTIGNREHRQFLDASQAEDVVVQAFAAMDSPAGQALLGNLPIASAKAVIIGHSQGSFAVTGARKRLIAAGLPDVVGTTVTIGGGLADPAQFKDDVGARMAFGTAYLATKFLPKKFISPDIRRYLEFCNQLSTGKIDVASLRALADLGVGSTIGPVPQKYARPQFILVGGSLSALDLLNPNNWAKASKLGTVPNDGILPLEMALAGQHTLQLPFHADHGYQIQYWGVVDAVFGKLATI